MPRNFRQYLPGHTFHVTARTQGRAEWFTDEIKSTIQDIIMEGVASSDARLLAHAVMSNHVHLLLIQGTAPLGWTMQPILRRIALRVQKAHGLEDHVFGGPYYNQPCRDVTHLQNTILYIHRNPVAAGCCADPDAYDWSSARAWAGLEPYGHIAVEDGLRAFGSTSTGMIDELRAVYVDALMRRHLPSDFLDGESRLRAPFQFIATRHVRPEQQHDLHDVAKAVMRTIGSEVDLEVVRSRYGGPRAAAVRRQLIAALIQRDHTGVKISKYMRISTTVVAKVKAQMRRAALERLGADSA